MDLAYCAAEHFVEFIGESPGYSITYVDLKSWRNWFDNKMHSDVSAYIVKESKHDSLFLFKKFPDIFVLRNNCVSFTDEFLTAYCLKKSSNYCAQFHNTDINIVNIAVTYFYKALIKSGPQQYLNLFNAFINDQTQQFAPFFCHYTVAEAYNFFLIHSNHFIIDKGMVFFNASVSLFGVVEKISPISLVINTKQTLKTMKKFVKYIHFLLRCFQRMHYMVLKQCISYVRHGISKILDNFSLVRQREFFESLSHSTMDEFGFLLLTTHKINVSFGKGKKAVLLVAYILAKTKKMHLKDLFVEVSERISLCNNSLTLEELVKYLRKHSSCFSMSDSGFVSLTSAYILPECSFQHQQMSMDGSKYIDHEVKLASPNLAFHDQSTVKSALCPSSSHATVNKSHSGLLQKPNGSVLCTYSLCISGLSKVLNERIKLSIFYLLKYFSPLNNNCVLKTLLHVLDDVRMSFCELSETHKHNFITVCCHFIETVSKWFEDAGVNVDVIFDAIEKEKIVLFVTYMLTGKEMIYYSKCTEAMKNNNIVSHLLALSDSDQFKYFKSISGYINITDDGYINLSQSFEPIKSIIESYPDLLSKHKPTYKPKMLQDKKSDKKTESKTTDQSKNISWTVLKENRNVAVEFKVPDELLQDTHKETVINSFSFDKVPENVYKILDYCANLLRKYFEFTASKDILKASIFALNDIYKYFCSLSTSDQSIFIEKCHKFINEKNPHCYPTIIGEKEENILFITYILLKQKMLHYVKIIKELERCNCRNLLSKHKGRSQFKYFKEAAEYFLINSDGIVTLHSSFTNVSSVIDSTISSLLKTRLKISIPNQIDSSKLDSKLYPQNNSKAINFHVQKSPNDNFVVLGNAGKMNKLQTLHVDSHTKNTIIDVCFFILSLCEKMSVEKLCYRLNSCNLKNIQNLFSYSTVTEKLSFFKNISPYFDVSKDNFVSLKKDADKMYIPKSNINLSEVFEMNSFDTDLQNFIQPFTVSQSRSESVNSADLEEFSELSSVEPTSEKKNIYDRGKNAKVSPRTQTGVFSNSSVHKNVSDTKSKPKIDNNNHTFLKTSASTPVIKKKDGFSPEAAINKDNKTSTEISETVSEFNPAVKPVYSWNKLKNIDSYNSSNEEISSQDEENIHLPSITTEAKSQEHFINKNITGTKSSFEIAFALVDETKISNEETNEKDGLTKLPSSAKVNSLIEKINTDSVVENIPEFKMPFKGINLYESTLINNFSEESGAECSKAIVNSFNKLSLCNNYESSSCYKSTTLKTVSCTESVTEYDAMQSALIAPSFEKSKTLPKPSNNLSNMIDSGNVQCDNFNDAHVIDSYLDNIDIKFSPNGTSNCRNAPEHQDAPLHSTFPNSFDESEILVKTASKSSKLNDDDISYDTYITNLIDTQLDSTCYPKDASSLNIPEHYDRHRKVSNSSSNQNSIYEKCASDTLPAVQDSSNCKELEHPICNSFPEDSMSVVPVEMLDVIESRAVNFFCIILANYECYESGISVDFLRKHIKMASSEVQSFMCDHCENDFLSFFQKHKEVFYVSIQSRNVYMLKKFPNFL